jgi:hypothetical protein
MLILLKIFIFTSLAFLLHSYSWFAKKTLLTNTGGIYMTYSKLKVLFYLTISLMLLFAPFSLEIFPGGETYAMGKWFSHDRSNSGSARHVRVANPEPKSGGPEPSPATGAPTPVPEPATMLLVGAGAVGLAAFRKKFRKKK